MDADFNGRVDTKNTTLLTNILFDQLRFVQTPSDCVFSDRARLTFVT